VIGYTGKETRKKTQQRWNGEVLAMGNYRNYTTINTLGERKLKRRSRLGVKKRLEERDMKQSSRAGREKKTGEKFVRTHAGSVTERQERRKYRRKHHAYRTIQCKNAREKLVQRGKERPGRPRTRTKKKKQEERHGLG